MKFNRFAATAGALVMVLLLAAPANAQNAQSDDSQTNVLMTFRLGTLEDGSKKIVKSYSLVVAAGTSGSRLLAGERVPFPASGEDGAIVYQNIGFVTDVRVMLLDKKRIMVVADIENSSIKDHGPGEPPTVETRQLAVNAVLTDGQPLELTRADGITDTSGFVEVEAKVLR